MAKNRIWVLPLLAALPLLYLRRHRNHYPRGRLNHGRRPLPAPTPSSPGFYLREEDYAKTMENLVLPYLNARMSQGFFDTGRHQLHYAHYRADHARASLVISHGFGESIARYAEPVYYFLNMGYDVYLPEHYGHGESSAGVTDRAVVWVDSFATYASDLQHFINAVVKKAHPRRPLLIFGHSMGGAIAVLCLEEFPDLCDGAILSAPMLRIQLYMPEKLAYPLADSLARSPLKKTLFLSNTYFEKLRFGTFELNRAATHSKARGLFIHQRRIHDKTPPRWIASWGWAFEAMKTSHEILRRENVGKIKVPLLMFQADADFFVHPAGMLEFAAHARNLQFFKVKGAFHEIYTERDHIIVPYFNKIQQFTEVIIRGVGKKEILNQRQEERKAQRQSTAQPRVPFSKTTPEIKR